MSAAACKIILDNAAIIQADLAESICRNAKEMRDADPNDLNKDQRASLAKTAEQMDRLNQFLTKTISEASAELAGGMLAGGEPLGGRAGEA